MKAGGPFVRRRTELSCAKGNNCDLAGDYVRQLPARETFTLNLENQTMKLFKNLSVMLLALVFVSALGCAGSPTQESTGEYVSDSWITTKVKATLVDDPIVKSTEVNVETFKGVVQLSGFVSSSAAMSQAVKVTKSIKGVTSVKNDMRIK